MLASTESVDWSDVDGAETSDATPCMTLVVSLALVPPTSLKFLEVVPCAFVRVPEASSMYQTPVNEGVQSSAVFVSVVEVVEVVVVVVVVTGTAVQSAGSVQLPHIVAFRPVTLNAVPLQLQSLP